MQLPSCPQCHFEYPYENQGKWICSNCSHERDDTQSWMQIFDVNGNLLADGDTVIVVKDLKFKGGVVKQGTKVKNIKLVDSDHNIDCKIDGIGAMGLKSEFVKKA